MRTIRDCLKAVNVWNLAAKVFPTWANAVPSKGLSQLLTYQSCHYGWALIRKGWIFHWIVHKDRSFCLRGANSSNWQESNFFSYEVITVSFTIQAWGIWGREKGFRRWESRERQGSMLLGWKTLGASNFELCKLLVQGSFTDSTNFTESLQELNNFKSPDLRRRLNFHTGAVFHFKHKKIQIFLILRII